MPSLAANYGLYIGTTGVFAESASLSQENTVDGQYFLGSQYRNTTNINGGVVNSLDYSAIMEMDKDPTLRNASGIKVNLTAANTLSHPINFAGVSGTFYLKSFSFSLLPNSPLVYQASYINFSNVSGTFTGRSYLYTGEINQRTVNGASAFITDINNARVPVYSLDYSLNVNVKPRYKIGLDIPYNVTALSAEENYEAEIETFNLVNFYGSDSYSVVFRSGRKITLQNMVPLSGRFTSEFDISGSVVTQISNNLNPNSAFTTKYKFQKYY